MNSVYELLKVFETEVDAFTQATLARIVSLFLRLSVYEA